MNNETTDNNRGSVCPTCETRLYPGGVVMRVLHNDHGDHYLGQACPACDAILARFSRDAPIRPEHKRTATRDPDPPEDWP